VFFRHRFYQENINTWHLQNINENIPEIYPETFEKFTPHDLNLQLIDAIDFEKGCYQGQEIIARMHYRGKLKQHLYRAVIETTQPITPCTKIINQENKTVGYIVDCCKNSNKTELLISAKDKAIDQDCFVERLKLSIQIK